jgi:hypothetical protein
MRPDLFVDERRLDNRPVLLWGEFEVSDTFSVDAAGHHVPMEWQTGTAWPLVEVDAVGAWAESGAQWLTTPGVAVPVRMIAGVAGLVRRLDEHGAGLADLYGAGGLGILSSRAAVLGLPPSGRVSCGGATRLLQTSDAWIAVALVRPDDLRSLPAWLGLEAHDPALDAPDPWPLLTERFALRTADEIVELGALLGLACSVLSEAATDTNDGSPVLMSRLGDAGSRPPSGVKVVNLASLWAGPLAADLLRRQGAEVICVESVDRPDGARATANWFASLHVGQEFVALDLRGDQGVTQLAALLRSADVVIEGSRPRALEQFGIDAADLVRAGPQVWVSITGHGRQLPGAMRVAFGDDAAAAGGLVGRLVDGPVFLADAVADPLAGLAAAVSVLDLLERGGRWMVDVSLSRVAACAAPRQDDPVLEARSKPVRPSVAVGKGDSLPFRPRKRARCSPT